MGQQEDLVQKLGISETELERLFRQVDLEGLKRTKKHIKQELGVTQLTIAPWPWRSWEEYNDKLGDPLWDCRIGTDRDHETLLRWQRHAEWEERQDQKGEKIREEIKRNYQTLRSEIKNYWEFKKQRGGD